MVLSTTMSASGARSFKSLLIVAISAILSNGLVGDSRRTMAVFPDLINGWRVVGSVVSTWWTVTPTCSLIYERRRFVPP